MSPSGWLYLVAGSQNVLAFIEVPDWTLWRAFQSMMQTKMRALSISPLDAGASFATLSIGFIVLRISISVQRGGLNMCIFDRIGHILQSLSS